MTEVIGVRFRTAGKVYYFSPAGQDVKRGSYVIVETARGVEMGKVVAPAHTVEDDKVVAPLREIIRIASREDLEQAAINSAKEKSSFQVCKQKIREHGLDMKLIDAEYTFDGSKLLFYFSADGRIDFRDLVKDLAGIFKTRIELRQIGVRDETKILGGIGICGRVLCCHSYLADFAPVTIKMAKDQSLSLNPTKISGTCGRLMCCLKNEQDTYEELNRHLPNLGDYVTTADGIGGKVQNVDVLRQRIRIIVENGEEKEIREIGASDIVSRVRKGKKKDNENEVVTEELKSLVDSTEENTGKKHDRKKPPMKKEKRENRENRENTRENKDNSGDREKKAFDKENVSRDKARHDRDKKKGDFKGHGHGKHGGFKKKNAAPKEESNG